MAIRINELARELEVKSRVVLEALPELGITDKKSHSSALDDEAADKVRAHFRALAGETAAETTKASAAPEPPPVTAAPETAAHPKIAAEIKKLIDTRLEAHPLTRSLEEIKATARKMVAPPPSPVKPSVSERPAHKPPVAPAHSAPGVAPPAPRPSPPIERQAEKLPEISPAAGPSAPPTPPMGASPAVAAAPPARASARPSVAEAALGKGSDARVTLRAGAAPEVNVPSVTPEMPPPPSPKPSRGTRGTRRPDPTASQPIYPHAVLPKTPVRPPVLRRPGEHRAMHPTSARGGSAAASAVAPAAAPTARSRVSAPPYSTPVRPTPTKPVAPEEVPITRKITVTEGVSIKELSEKLNVRAKDVIKRLLDKGIFATINQTLDSQTAIDVARAFGAEASVISFEEEILQEFEEADRPEDLKPRPPVVTVMGHVDHGKTTLLDAIRETNVAAHEAGGITQSIGAYQAEVQGRKITFIDTPGHEAFTMMRARGAKATDIVVLVVAADDGVMPQTIEAINHARAAKSPIVVAVNKVDKPEAQPDRVKKQLADLGLMPEAWGGDTVMVDVSAKKRQNLDLLLEMILLVADLQGLKANPKRPASGTVLEARLDRGRGPVATLLVQNGTLRVGDSFIVGAIYGKVRAMFDDRGRPCIEAPPSTPVEVLGLEDVPQAGDRLQVIEDTLKARQIALHRQAKLREAALAKSARLTLEQFHQQLAAGDVKELPLVIKADVQGSVEVLADALNRLSTDKVKVKIIHSGVGAITETDVLLASASNAVIIGFNVRPERKASELAQLENVDIRLHTIIYNVTDEIRKAMSGLLAVTYKEISLGRAEVRETFRISKVGTVAGSYVQDGKITRDARVRLLRDNVVVFEGQIRSLRRFKDDVPEVKSGMECGISLENFNDVKVGDVIEAYVKERVEQPPI
jgi:translation initiation factor IF-2